VHVVNGEHQALTTHDLVFVRPADEHAFGTVRKSDFTIINLAFPPDCLEFLLGRYALAGAGVADWWQAWGAPRVWHLSPAESHRVAAAFAQLADMPQARLTVEKFLLNVICDTTAIRQGDPFANCPDWLRKALRELHAAPAAALQEGPAGLARLCGRTLEHVSRVLMAGTGLTPTQVVNQVRLQRAATLLSTTDTPADRVSLECGYQSVSHFFRLFRQHYGLTPRQYRQRTRRVVGLG
jgi:AraC family cel operon transcriptional repressor